MKKRHIALSLSISLLMLGACKQAIKNENSKVDDEVATQSSQVPNTTRSISNEHLNVNSHEDLLGFWVGYFMPHESIRQEQQNIYADESLIWNRENKINLSIDSIGKDGQVKGHSVVAGNSRPFKGTVKEVGNKYVFEASEPGDDKYDGKFNFEISKGDTLVKGTWTAYKKLQISKRQYELTKKIFKYNPQQALVYSRAYGNWEKVKKTKVTDAEEREYYGDYYKEFAAAGEEIYQINASEKLLSKSDVENLSKSDLLIIRNCIYARHGYSFKNRPLRVFFDAQPWYIPVHVNIKSDFTDIEKKNIELLLKYEKNAKEYYDSFGRG